MPNSLKNNGTTNINKCSLNFLTRLNLLNCNKHRAKTSFLLSQASHFGIENPSKIHVFSRHPPGPHFSSFYVILCRKKTIPGPPFKIQWAPIGDQNLTIGAQMLQKTYVPLLRGASLEPTGAPEAARYAQGFALNDFWRLLALPRLQFQRF